MNDRKKGADEAMEVAESSRETEWEKPSFVGRLFLGDLRLDLIHPFPEQDPDDEREGDEWIDKLERFLVDNVDGDRIDEEGEYPEEILEGLRKLGAFGMKIPKEYGGLGLSQVNYNRSISLVATHCGSTVAWLSAHQSIGVPQPLKLFGTEEQKKKWLPRLAEGAISAFALTEPGVGSDPARMTTTAVRSEDGKGWIINGEKLWCTNGLNAELLVVMAQTPPKVVNGREKKQISAFVVETDREGYEVTHRCQFMGLRGIGNVLLKFTDLYVPDENLLWEEGLGLKLALITLNTGRLTIPVGCAAASRRALEITRDWATERVQWGHPIGEHEAVAAMIAKMASHTFAMEAISWLTAGLADRGEVDLRLEAAMAKLFNTEVMWQVMDDLVQIRGGRGYETAASLKARGEKPWPVERMLRDSRINRIFEGTSEIQHLFIAREAVDPHMKVAGVLLNKKASVREKAAGLAKAGLHYATWYPKLYTGWGHYPRYSEFGALSRHMGYIDRTSRRLARQIFHAMSLYQAKLEKKQRTLFRIVDIGTDLFAMASSITYAMWQARRKGHENAIDLADVFCNQARVRIEQNFDRLFQNDDPQEYRLVRQFLDGEYQWLEGRLVEQGFATPSQEEVDRAVEEMVRQ
jgi:alkylation response protein AidB-like acyl-CoA dehydrogenase